MHIEVAGINYKNTPVAVRSKVAIGSTQLEEALVLLHQYVHQGIIVCTCNRLEIYTLSLNNENSSGAIAFLKARSGLSENDLSAHVYHYKDADAVQNLFRVAAGLDSMVIGEYEILGQVKRSLHEAQKSGLVGPQLQELFRRAVSCGRKIRIETEISKNALSVSSVAVDTAMQATNELKHRKILIIGCGEAGKQVARVSRSRGAEQITVLCRSLKKGKAFAKEVQGKWSPMRNIEEELVDHDAVICCSGAPHTVLKTRMVNRAMELRSQRPLVIIDIGVPCNVDPEVKGLKNVFLHNIDEFTNICKLNYEQRRDEIKKAEAIIDLEKSKFMEYWQGIKVQPIIKALVNKAEHIRQTKLASALKRMPSLSVQERYQFELLSKSIVQKLLHEPIQSLKANHKNEQYIDMVSQLFCLEEQK